MLLLTSQRIPDSPPVGKFNRTRPIDYVWFLTLKNEDEVKDEAVHGEVRYPDAVKNKRIDGTHKTNRLHPMGVIMKKRTDSTHKTNKLHPMGIIMRFFTFIKSWKLHKLYHCIIICMKFGSKAAAISCSCLTCLISCSSPLQMVSCTGYLSQCYF